jgi:hypothetical protein
VRGGPLGELWGVGGRATAGYTVDHRKS